MKIAIDGYELGREARGVGRVLHNILLHSFDLLPDANFMVYTKEPVGKYTHSRVSEQVLPHRSSYLRWQNGPLRRALQASKPDIFIAFNYILPLSHPRESVLFEHDVSVVAHPEWYPHRYALTRKLLIRRSLKRAKLVIVPSEFTKQEILSFSGVETEKIHVLVYGVEESFRRASEEDILRWKAERGLAGKRVIGFLGSFFKRRHVPVLVGAVGLLRRECPEAMLYLVGKNFDGLSKKEMEKMPSREWVRWDPEVAEKELPLYYSSLDAFVFLSEYEGFGFPPLESLACGTPVVLLKRAALKEIFEGMAFMVDSPEEIEVARALRMALSDEAERGRSLGIFEQRRPEFAWPNVALEFSLLIRRIAPKAGA